MTLYRDWTREYVVYNREGDIPDWLADIHRDHLNKLNRIARKMGVFIRVDFCVGLGRGLPHHQTYLDIRTSRGDGLATRMVGSYFYDGITPVSQDSIGMIRHPHLVTLFELYKRGFHHDDIQALL